MRLLGQALGMEGTCFRQSGLPVGPHFYFQIHTGRLRPPSFLGLQAQQLPLEFKTWSCHWPQTQLALLACINPTTTSSLHRRKERAR